MRSDTRKYRLMIIICIAVTFFVFMLSISMGRYSIPFWTVLQALTLQESVDATIRSVIFEIRLPRIIAAMLVGAALSVSGAAFQGLFKNPLVSSYHLGVSSGAGFGAALAILLAAGTFAIQLYAFTFGALAVAASFGLSRLVKGSSTLTLVLAGMVVGSFFSALISILEYVSNPLETLPLIVFWLMGSFNAIRIPDLINITPIILIGIAGVMLIRWRINILSMGEDEAQALGIDLKRIIGILVFCCTLSTAASVCIAGVIGWVGLVIPHIGRMFVGPDFKKLIPMSAIIGANYLLLMDDIARTITMGEIPIGILTSLVGTPFFAVLLWRNKVGWS